jgi:hypothetical protein
VRPDTATREETNLLSGLIYRHGSQNFIHQKQNRALAAFLTLLVCAIVIAIVDYGVVRLPVGVINTHVTMMSLFSTKQAPKLDSGRKYADDQIKPVTAQIPQFAIAPEQKPKIISEAIVLSNTFSDSLPVIGFSTDFGSSSGDQAGSPGTCHLSLSSAPARLGGGTVLGFEDRAASLVRMRQTQAILHGEIDPAYIYNQRIIVQLDNGQTRALILPEEMQVHAGDRVQAQETYRSPALPCNYVPNLIVSAP